MDQESTQRLTNLVMPQIVACVEALDENAVHMFNIACHHYNDEGVGGKNLDVFVINNVRVRKMIEELLDKELGEREQTSP